MRLCPIDVVQAAKKAVNNVELRLSKANTTSLTSSKTRLGLTNDCCDLLLDIWSKSLAAIALFFLRMLGTCCVVNAKHHTVLESMPGFELNMDNASSLVWNAPVFGASAVDQNRIEGIERCRLCARSIFLNNRLQGMDEGL